MRVMMKSKIHRATVTQADLDYVGSIAIDSALMEAADLIEGEQVVIADRPVYSTPAAALEGDRDGRWTRERLRSALIEHLDEDSANTIAGSVSKAQLEKCRNRHDRLVVLGV